MWVYLAAAVAILGLLSGMAYLAKAYLDGVDERAHQRGIAEERARWQSRESAELAQANGAIAFLNDAYRKREAAFALELNKHSQAYQEGRRRAQAQHDRDLAAVRDGFRLRDPAAAPATACQGGGGSGPAAPGTAAGGPDAAGRGDLSREATEFLLGEANRADAVVDKLHRLQGLVTSYWQACGAPKAGAAP